MNWYFVYFTSNGIPKAYLCPPNQDREGAQGCIRVIEQFNYNSFPVYGVKANSPEEAITYALSKGFTYKPNEYVIENQMSMPLMSMSSTCMYHSSILDKYDLPSSPNLILGGDFESMQHDALDNIQFTELVSDLDIKEFYYSNNPKLETEE